MKPNDIIRILKKEISQTFKGITPWISKAPELQHFNSKNEFWNILEILEHIILVNHYLIILILKGTKKALKNVQGRNMKKELENYELSCDNLEEIGINNSFQWNAPAHMVPSGNESLDKIHERLKDQEKQCRNTLLQLKDGHGVLYQTTMNVNLLGKLDVYQYLYFLLKHMQRHIGQMEEIEDEYTNSLRSSS